MSDDHDRLLQILRHFDEIADRFELKLKIDSIDKLLDPLLYQTIFKLIFPDRYDEISLVMQAKEPRPAKLRRWFEFLLRGFRNTAHINLTKLLAGSVQQLHYVWDVIHFFFAHYEPVERDRAGANLGDLELAVAGQLKSVRAHYEQIFSNLKEDPPMQVKVLGQMDRIDSEIQKIRAEERFRMQHKLGKQLLEKQKYQANLTTTAGGAQKKRPASAQPAADLQLRNAQCKAKQLALLENKVLEQFRGYDVARAQRLANFKQVAHK